MAARRGPLEAIAILLDHGEIGVKGCGYYSGAVRQPRKIELVKEEKLNCKMDCMIFP
jgi:hypothetical protein